MSNAKVVGVLLGGVCLGAAVGVAVTSTVLKNNASRTTSASSGSCSVDGATSQTAALFEVDGKQYTREDLSTEMQDQLFQMQSQLHDASANLVKEVALRFALAKDKKIDVGSGKELPDLKTLMEPKKVTEADMKAFFEENKKSLPPGTTFEQVRPQLEQFMQGQQMGEQVRQEVAKFEEKGRLKILMKAPVAPLVNLDLAGLPFKGSETAKVVVVEASDYLCTHCRDAVESTEKLVKEYGSKIKFVQANFALRPTGLSGVLARGAWCAGKQGNEQFWKFHEKAFAVPLEAANPISPNTEKAYADTALKAAQDSGIDVKVFETCLASEESKKAIESANAKLTAAGVSATPTFFVNNRKVGSPANLSSAIAVELERLSANPSKAN
jgi:protein-disulfide isomerase